VDLLAGDFETFFGIVPALEFFSDGGGDDRRRIVAGERLDDEGFYLVGKLTHDRHVPHADAIDAGAISGPAAAASIIARTCAASAP
jgi:hypothetical protein